MHYILMRVYNALIAPLIRLVWEIYGFFTNPNDTKVEGEVETVDWCREKLGWEFGSLEELWESGARAISHLLEDESETWRDLQDTAVRKINITPALDQSQLNSSYLERKAKQNFILLLKKIKKFIEKPETNDPVLRVSHDIMARGVGLYAAYTNRRAVFYVYSAIGELDNINVNMKGRAEVRMETKKRLGRLMVGYIAREKGTYFLYISKNGWMAPGCPFEVFVDNPPIGYQGSFGASEWDLPQDNTNCFFNNYWKIGAKKPKEPSLKKKKSQNQKLSKIARLIINAKKLFASSSFEIPKIEISEEKDEFSVWSSMTEFGAPPQRRRSFTFISSEGATFPLALSSEGDSKFFDTFENLDIFKNDNADLWAVQTEESDSVSQKDCLLRSRRNSEEVFRTPNLTFEPSPNGRVKGELDLDEKNQFNHSIIPVNQMSEHKLAIMENENMKNLIKEGNLKRSFDKLGSDSSLDESKTHSIPSLDVLETASETSVCEKVIEVALFKKYECSVKRERKLFLGERRCKSILSVFDLKRSGKKKDLRRTKSASLGRSTNVLSCFKNTKKVIVKIGEYTTNKEEIKASRPVKKWKNYWDNLLERKEGELKKCCSIELNGVVAKGKTVFEELAKQNSSASSAQLKVKNGNRKQFEKARNVFSSLELYTSDNPPLPQKRKSKADQSDKISRSLERDLKGLFDDMNHGIGMPGIPNRLALLASLRSIEPENPPTFEPNYPYLPTTKPSDYKPRTSSRELIPWNQILSAF